MEIEKEQKAIRAKLCLLARRMRLHEWTFLGEKEAEELEIEEMKIDSEDYNSTADEPCGEL